LGRLALHFRVKHLDGGFINLQIAAGFHRLPHGVVNRS
jgi:hypothetical protein